MESSDTTSGVTVRLGKSPLTDFIIMFSDKMHVLDQICVDLTKIADEIDEKEQELEGMFNDLYQRTSQSPRCPSLQCSCWTVAPLTRRFLNVFRGMRGQKIQSRQLKDRAYSLIDGFKDTREKSLEDPMDLSKK